ncbi:hypothetical protein ACFLSA_06295, partial [Bacteroidota bacterium]
MQKIEKPGIVVLGLSLDLYEQTFDDIIEKQEKQLTMFTSGLEKSVEIISRKVCFLSEQMEKEILQAKINNADALLIVPMCYTASTMSVPSLLETNIPIIVFNTQEILEIKDDFDFDDLIDNHVIQGTQDVTNILIRNEKIFGMETGHYQDETT